MSGFPTTWTSPLTTWPSTTASTLLLTAPADRVASYIRDHQLQGPGRLRIAVEPWPSRLECASNLW